MHPSALPGLARPLPPLLQLQCNATSAPLLVSPVDGPCLCRVTSPQADMMVLRCVRQRAFVLASLPSPPSPPCSVLRTWPAVPISWSSDVAHQQQQRRHQGGPLPGSRVHGGPFPAFLDAAYPMAMGVHQSGSTSLPALGARACHACLSQAKPNAPDNNRHHQNNSERQFQVSPGIPRRGYYLLRNLRQSEHARMNIASTQAM